MEQCYILVPAKYEQILGGREIMHWPKWNSNAYILHIFDNDLYKNHIGEVCPFEANIWFLCLFYVKI